ncbi:MAG: CPBP family intramembrane glutamic endopeptidase [Promethearchaeota archaeon]
MNSGESRDSLDYGASQEPRVQNVAGQWEQETKSRKWNLVEPVLAMALIQVVMWGIWFPMELANDKNAENVAYILLGAIVLLFPIMSPFLHKDTLKGWGIGDPRHVIQKIREGDAKTKAFFTGIVALFVVVALVALLTLWEDAAGFMGIDRDVARHMKTTPGGLAEIVLIAILLGLFVGLVVVRYDNFLHSLKVAFVVIAALGVPLLILAVFVGDFSKVTLGGFAIGVFGYIWWGAIQQLAFASYFGSRFRKAFSPAQELEDPEHATREEERKLYKKRAVVAILNGSFFGLIHIPSWTLVAFTILLGVILSWLFMKDQNRNLIALGFIHGFLGSMAGQFFSDDVVEMSVGPGAVPPNVVPWMWLVMVFVALLLVAIVLTWLHYEKNRPGK